MSKVIPLKTQQSIFIDPLEGSFYHDSDPTVITSSSGSYLKSPYASSDSNVQVAGENDIINFEAIEYLCFENEGTVEMVVVRNGPFLEEIDLIWDSIDMSFGRTYRKLSGAFTMLKGERRRTIIVETLQGGKNDFDVEALVDIKLDFKKPEENKHSLFGDVRKSRIVCLNADEFPSGVTDLTNQGKLVKGFIWHNYKMFKKKVWKGFLLNIVPGITFVANQFITQYLLKTIALATLENANKDEVSDDKYQFLYFLAFAYIINFLFSYYCDFEFAKLRLGGCVGLSIRSMCVDTVIQFSSQVEDFDVGRIIKTNERDVNIAIQTSWLACFKLTGNFIKLLFMIFFLCLTAIDQAIASDTPSLPLIILIPLFVIVADFVILKMTVKSASINNRAALDADDIWSSFLAQLANLRTSITNYRKGFMVTQEFEKLYKAYNKANFAASIFALHTSWIVSTISMFASALVMMVVSQSVISGYMDLSAFVVFFSTMNQFGPTLSALFMNVFDINKGYASIIKLAALLNSDTRRKLLYRTQKNRKKLMALYDEDPKNEKWGNFDIVVHNVSYAFPNSRELVLNKFSTRLEGGQIIAVCGGPSVGKKSLLRLIARHFNPIDGGFIHYPSRWRVRYIDGSTCFFGGDQKEVRLAKEKGGDGLINVLKQSTGTLDYNVKFGVQHVPENTDVWDEEIFTLFQHLGLSAQLIGENFKEYSVGTEAKKYTMIGLNGDKMSQTDRCLLVIACTLLSSVDLLLISNILDILGPVRSAAVLRVLREFTEGRGLGNILKTEVNSTPFHLRKRKTVIFSSKIKSLQKLADNWLLFENGDYEEGVAR